MSNKQIHTVYKKLDGTRVPSVTTYLGILNKPALVPWAWKLGVEGLDFNKVKDEAGRIGTLAHYMINVELSNKPYDEAFMRDYTPNEIEQASIPMAKFNEWKVQHILNPIVMEEPLVSEVYGFGGTPDFYGEVDSVLTLLDWKTGKTIYDEAFSQVAAYKELLVEHGHEVEAIRILRFGKDEIEGFEDRVVENTDLHWELFRHCQDIYELQKAIRRGKR